MERPFASVTRYGKGRTYALRGGHPWRSPGRCSRKKALPGRGDRGRDTEKAAGRARGFYNGCSLIRVRILLAQHERTKWTRRFSAAVSGMRSPTAAGHGRGLCCLPPHLRRGGRLPGWTVDRYGDVLVSEVLSLGIEQRRAMLYALLREELAALGVNVSCIYERNESLIREKEGMTCGKGPYAAPGLETNPSGHAEICENGIYFDVDYINGQKTGYFLDQKYNRAAAGRLAHGRRVLDCFTHTGAFALHCAAGGAESVTAVDVSASALEQARRNAERNGIEGRMEFRQADVFELLQELGKSGEKPWDYIILDPPAFTKSGATVENARRGYREINRRAMQILPRGGYLATCSCSHFMTDTLFRAMLADAARDASVQLRQIEARQQSPDHPILWGVPETDYLKFYLFQIV